MELPNKKVILSIIRNISVFLLVGVASGALPAEDVKTNPTDKCAAKEDTQKIAKSDDDKCTLTPPSGDVKCEKTKVALKKATDDLETCTGSTEGSTPATTPPNTDYAVISAKLDQVLANHKNSDFELQLGIGSLIRNGLSTDYADNTNILSASNLGNATPQYLVGVGLRTPIPNFKKIGPDYDECQAARDIRTGKKTEEEAKKDNPGGCPYYRENRFLVSLASNSHHNQTVPSSAMS